MINAALLKSRIYEYRCGSFGAMVFIAAQRDKIPLIDWVFKSNVGLSAIVLASLSLILLWYLLIKGKTKILRVLAGFQVTMILLAISYAHFPNFIRLKSGDAISLLETAGPEKPFTVWV